MKTKKQKQGISLMVLILTIIIMVILAGTVIISLNNAGVINRSQNAVSEYNLKQVEELANVAWGEAFVAGNRTKEDLEEYVLEDLRANGINLNNYNVEVTEKGVVVTVSNGENTTTLGALVASPLDYGKTVNYEANGVTGWKVFFKQTVEGEEYVYLIASESIPNSAIPKNIPGTTVSDHYIYWSSVPTTQANIEHKALWMAEWEDYGEYENGRCVSQLLSEQYWTSFKNTKYGQNVVGAIGTPTLEMFAASYNERSIALNDTGENSTLTLTKDECGYNINGEFSVALSRQDKLYVFDYIWLASVSSNEVDSLMCTYIGDYVVNSVYHCDCNGVRPVVCLKSSIKASAGLEADSTDIILK